VHVHGCPWIPCVSMDSHKLRGGSGVVGMGGMVILFHVQGIISTNPGFEVAQPCVTVRSAAGLRSQRAVSTMRFVRGDGRGGGPEGEDDDD
jgi:hypothetical protein